MFKWIQFVTESNWFISKNKISRLVCMSLWRNIEFICVNNKVIYFHFAKVVWKLKNKTFLFYQIFYSHKNKITNFEIKSPVSGSWIYIYDVFSCADAQSAFEKNSLLQFPCAGVQWVKNIAVSSFSEISQKLGKPYILYFLEIQMLNFIS